MRYMLLAALVASVGGCISEPDVLSHKEGIAAMEAPPRQYEEVVSRPILFQDLPDYLDTAKKYGWEFVSAELAGAEFPASYLVICRRPR